MDILRVIKTVTPAVLVLVAGLFGLNFVYNTYMDKNAGTVITLEPAAGEEATTTVEDTVQATEEVAKDAVDATVDAAKDAGAAAAETTGDVVDATKEAAKDAAEVVEEKVEDVKEAVEEKVEEVKEEQAAE